MANLKNILLTGGAGYIGSHVALSLIDRGHNVTIIDSLVTGSKKIVPKKANFIQSDIANVETLESLFSNNRFDALMHFAAFIKVEESIEKPNEYFDNNVRKSSVLFDTCIKHKLNNIIFSSTAAVYGNKSKFPIIEDTILSPLNPYSRSKLLTEEYLEKLSKEKKVNYIVLRYFNVAGADPLLRSGLITKNPTHLIKVASEVAVKKRDHIEIFGNDYPTPDGTAVRDYISVSDIADVHVLSLNYLLDKKKSLVMNCGYGHGYSVKEILDKINLIIDKPLNIKIGKRRKGDAVSLIADIQKIKKLLKWEPKHDKLEDILNTAIKWEKKILHE